MSFAQSVRGDTAQSNVNVAEQAVSCVKVLGADRCAAGGGSRVTQAPDLTAASGEGSGGHRDIAADIASCEMEGGRWTKVNRGKEG